MKYIQKEVKVKTKMLLGQLALVDTWSQISKSNLIYSSA